ncbi:hypothetical protein PI125_g15875 [Phytophthora idaei]|nr:hypothetical protein PI125_g15875 [Phytophthora idaei]
MVKVVKPGAQITVHYGNERWFQCTCDACSQDPGEERELEDSENGRR